MILRPRAAAPARREAPGPVHPGPAPRAAAGDRAAAAAWVPAAVLAGASAGSAAPFGEGAVLAAGLVLGLTFSTALGGRGTVPDARPRLMPALAGARAVLAAASLLLVAAQLPVLALAAAYLFGATWTAGLLLAAAALLLIPPVFPGRAAFILLLAAVALPSGALLWAAWSGAASAAPAREVLATSAAVLTACVAAAGTAVLARGAGLPGASRPRAFPRVLAAPAPLLAALLLLPVALLAGWVAAAGLPGASFSALPGWFGAWRAEGPGGSSWVEAVDRDGDGLLGAGELFVRGAALFPVASSMLGFPPFFSALALAAAASCALWGARGLLGRFRASGKVPDFLLRPAVLAAALPFAWLSGGNVPGLVSAALGLAAPLFPLLLPQRVPAATRARAAATGGLAAALVLGWLSFDPLGVLRLGGDRAAIRAGAAIVLAAPGAGTGEKALAQALLAGAPADGPLFRPFRAALVPRQGRVAVRVRGLEPAVLAGLAGAAVAALTAAAGLLARRRPAA